MFKKIVLIQVCLILTLCLPVCAKQQESTSMEIRQMQTRTYEVKTKKELMEAIVNVLQDRDYLITESNYNLGVVSGYKECKEKAFLGQRFVRFETSVQINELGKNSYKVRTNFIKKALDLTGNPTTKQEIKNPEEFYREFFSQLDKSLFIESQGI